jgi:hypothetical protein
VSPEQHSWLMREVRSALRLLRHRPGFCGAVVLTLAIGLGSTTAIFSVVNALILRPLPFPDAHRLVEVTSVVGGDQGRLTLFEYRDLARETRMFDGWGAFYRSQYNVTGGGPPEALTCTIASSTMFSVLGVRPIYGDVWPETQDFTRQFLVMLSHRVWQQRFGGRPEVVGSTITMDGAPYRVTGVLPEGFDFPVRTDVFRSVTDYNAPHVRRYSAVARIRAGATLADAQAELDALSARFAEMYPQAQHWRPASRDSPSRCVCRARTPVHTGARWGRPAAPGHRHGERHQPPGLARDRDARGVRRAPGPRSRTTAPRPAIDSRGPRVGGDRGCAWNDRRTLRTQWHDVPRSTGPSALVRHSDRSLGIILRDGSRKRDGGWRGHPAGVAVLNR